MKKAGFTLLYIVSLMVLSAVYSAAIACNLSSIDKKEEIFTLKIDHQPVNLSVDSSYRFKSQEDGENVLITGSGTLGFEDFDAVYKRFVDLRMIPKSKCDILRPTSHKVFLDSKSGMVLAGFYLTYEDKRCFALRFFDPVTDPGVSKESQVYKTGRHGFSVKNAFQPKIENGSFVINMATIYDGNGEKIIKKLSEYPLEGFLGSSSFNEFAQNALFSGKFEMLNSMQNTKTLDMRFKDDEEKRRHIEVTLETVMPKSSACSVYQSLLNTGKWNIQ